MTDQHLKITNTNIKKTEHLVIRLINVDRTNKCLKIGNRNLKLINKLQLLY